MHTSIRFSRISLALAALALAGCAETASFRQPYAEPIGSPSSKVRVVTNGSIRFIPGRACVDWSTAGSGLVASDFYGKEKSPTLNGQKLGMSSAPIPRPGFYNAEVVVRANEPLTVVFNADQADKFMTTRRWCPPMNVAFIPQSGEEYEIVGEMTAYCRVQIKSLTNPGLPPAQTQVSDCP